MVLRVFERHIAREVYSATALVTVAFLALIGFFDLTFELADIGKGGYQFWNALAFVGLTLPGRAYEILPVSVLIGSLYALTHLARDSEITVLRSSGLSTKTFLWALMRIAMAFVVVTLLLGELVVPPAEKAAQAMRLRAMGSIVGQNFRSGLWVKDDLSFVNVREVSPDAGLKGIRIYAFDTDFRLKSISEAETGVYLGDQKWRLSGLVQTEFSADGAKIERWSEFEWKSALNPDLVSVLMVNPERMSLPTLYQYVNFLDSNQQKSARYEIALWKKLVYPLAAMVMMIIALPFAYMQDRMGAVNVRVFAGIMLGIGFHMLNGLFSSLGVINSWQPFYSAITPSIIFLLAGMTMLWWVERR
jgi:lipopolysaccharide export system permease protein